MFTTYRIIPASSWTSLRKFSQLISNTRPSYSSTVPKYLDEQVDLLKASIQQNSVSTDWAALKERVLSLRGNVTQKNIDGIFLKVMVSSKKIEAALSYADYVKKSGDLSLGSINGIFQMYYELGKLNRITEEDKKYIFQLSKDLYKKYKVLDFTTCENLLHVMCAINEYKMCFKLLDEIKLSGTPSHSAYSLVIATLLKNNKLADAKKMMLQSISEKRPLRDEVYEEWIKYIFRKYKTNKVIEKNLESMLDNISENFVSLSEKTMNTVKDTYASLGWDTALTSINKEDGSCRVCKSSLQNLTLSAEEFKLLQDNVKQKLIVGSDLFIKTSPAELERFLNHLKLTAPYDIVLDGLNIALAAGSGHVGDKVSLLRNVVQHFLAQNKKIFLLGRMHMLRWPRRQMEFILQNTSWFFTEDLTHDDPFFITAALYSGPHTDIVSKDMLRGHKFLMRDERLARAFQRWQWQRQWMVFGRQGRDIQPPLRFSPCGQRTGPGWHLPYCRDPPSWAPRPPAAPQWGAWLCMRPPAEIK